MCVLPIILILHICNICCIYMYNLFMCLSYHYEQSVWITKPKVLYSPYKTLKIKKKQQQQNNN